MAPQVWPGEARRKGKSFVFEPIPITADEQAAAKREPPRAPAEAPAEAAVAMPEVHAKTYAEVVVAEPATNVAEETIAEDEAASMVCPNPSPNPDPDPQTHYTQGVR